MDESNIDDVSKDCRVYVCVRSWYPDDRSDAWSDLHPTKDNSWYMPGLDMDESNIDDVSKGSNVYEKCIGSATGDNHLDDGQLLWRPVQQQGLCVHPAGDCRPDSRHRVGRKHDAHLRLPGEWYSVRVRRGVLPWWGVYWITRDEQCDSLDDRDDRDRWC